jgi:zinc protease
VTAVLGAGGSRGDGDKPGAAALALELASARLAVPGAQIETHIATDVATIEVITTSSFLVPALRQLGELDRAPPPTAAELAGVRDRQLADLRERRTRPRTIAAQVFDRVVFGAHPYGAPAEGLPETVAALTADDVAAAWARTFSANDVTLIVAGAADVQSIRRAADAAFARWLRSIPVATPWVPAYAPQLAVVDVPGARQSVVLIGTRAAAAGDPQQLAGELANAIVGGGIGARLDRRLHDELGLTLGASASFWRGRWAGSWALATTFATERTLEGIRTALALVEAARTDISAAELARARADLLAAAQLAFETNAGTVRALERLAAQGLPLDGYATYDKRVRAITLDGVRAAAAWRDLSIVVVGDWTKLQTELSSLALPIVHYDRAGAVLP